MAVSFIVGGNGSIKKYETSISSFMSNITIEIYTMFLFIHVVQQMWTVPVVQSTKIHSTIWYWECHDYCTLKINFVDFEIEIHCSCYTMLFCYRPINLIYYTCPVAVNVAATFILFFPHLYIKFYICCELLNWKIINLIENKHSLPGAWIAHLVYK